MITHIIDVIKGKHPITARRSSHWPSVRLAHLLQHPTCIVCGGTKKLQVHHIKPFHLYPELELIPDNLATLCEAKRGGVNCHLWFGHLGWFKSFNVDVIANAAEWIAKFKGRPT